MDIHLTRAWVQAMAAAMDQHKDHLTQLDSAIGDADHGVNMQRGFTAVLKALDGYEAAGVGDVLVKTGTTLISNVGGAAGPLYGTFFRASGRQLTGPTADAGQLAAAFDAGLAGVQKLGAAVPGDKTMVDALVPALAAFGEAARAGEGRGRGRRAGREGRRDRHAGHHPLAGPQGTRVLPRRPQRRAPGPRRHLHRAGLPNPRGGAPVVTRSTFVGHLASAGTALGLLHHTDLPPVAPPGTPSPGADPAPGSGSDPAPDPVAEVTEAFDAVAGQLAGLSQTLRASGQTDMADMADIVEVDGYIALDGELRGAAVQQVRAGQPASDAVVLAVHEYAALLAALDDPTLAERAADVRQVGRRVLAYLAGARSAVPEGPVVLAAQEIGAADLLEYGERSSPRPR